MNIKPVSGPNAIPQNGTPEHVRTQKAMAAFNKGHSSYDTPPVSNQEPQVQPQRVEQKQAVSQEPTQTATSNELQPIDSALPASEQPPAKVEDPKASEQFSQLAKQARALRQRQQQQEQAMKAREAELFKREEAIKAQESKYTQGYIQQDALKQDPLKALLDAGVSYEALTEKLLAQSNPLDPRVEAMFSKQEAEIKALKIQNEELRNQSKTAEETQYQAAVKQIRADVTSLVNQGTDYEGIKATNSINDVVELIERTFKEDGILMSTEEAAQEIEDYIIEEADKLSRLSKLEKRRQQASKPVEAPQAQQSAQAQVTKQPQPMKTLTNATSSTRPLSARERALLAFRGEKIR